MHFGKAIRKKLIDADQSITWLAGETGVTRSAMSQTCSRRHINTSRLRPICDALDLTVLEMLLFAAEDEDLKECK